MFHFYFLNWHYFHTNLKLFMYLRKTLALTKCLLVLTHCKLLRYWDNKFPILHEISDARWPFQLPEARLESSSWWWFSRSSEMNSLFLRELPICQTERLSCRVPSSEVGFLFSFQRWQRDYLNFVCGFEKRGHHNPGPLPGLGRKALKSSSPLRALVLESHWHVSHLFLRPIK